MTDTRWCESGPWSLAQRPAWEKRESPGWGWPGLSRGVRDRRCFSRGRHFGRIRINLVVCAIHSSVHLRLHSLYAGCYRNFSVTWEASFYASNWRKMQSLMPSPRETAGSDARVGCEPGQVRKEAALSKPALCRRVPGRLPRRWVVINKMNAKTPRRQEEKRSFLASWRLGVLHF